MKYRDSVRARTSAVVSAVTVAADPFFDAGLTVLIVRAPPIRLGMETTIGGNCVCPLHLTTPNRHAIHKKLNNNNYNNKSRKSNIETKIVIRFHSRMMQWRLLAARSWGTTTTLCPTSDAVGWAHVLIHLKIYENAFSKSSQIRKGWDTDQLLTLAVAFVGQSVGIFFRDGL